MKMYSGIDLHSNNSYVAILDEGLGNVVSRRLKNDIRVILEFFEPYRDELEAIAVESTYNWYWLVDGLKEAGYDIRLMNTTKATRYSDLKYTDDKHDARWIARLLALGILPEGYIVPPDERAVRDLLRRRSFLVRKRTANLLSIQTLVQRTTSQRIPTADIRTWTTDTVQQLIGDPVVSQSIALLLPVLRVLTAQIRTAEKTALEIGKLRHEFRLLKTAPGIGDILALTIMYETVDPARFPRVGNFISYCRCAKSEHISNHKKKGSGNRKNGNQYLSWAFSEAAHHALRCDPLAKRYHDRKRSRCHPMVAKRALAAKIARGVYYVLRDRTPFESSRAFA
jgi:transposase